MSVTGKQALINPARILYTLLNPKRAQEAVWMSFEQIRQEINRDRLWGAEAIAAVINLTPRQTWYLLEKHLLWCELRVETDHIQRLAAISDGLAND